MDIADFYPSWIPNIIQTLITKEVLPLIADEAVSLAEDALSFVYNV